ncbi:MAG TPA: proline-rich domain-containing protein [Streptosporangiaceae bacterium]|nr:proline-rich domain-containing protein [Streptosporangiaceae bacterium]
MMTESQALETLTREDPTAAGDAKAALAWLTGDEGLETISLLRLQEFLWYALPVKWPMSTPGRVGVARALGRLFDLAGLHRYAGVCASAGTEQIITAYADGHEEGIAAYTEAIDASNAAPPDTELLAWGSVMGVQERAAYDACAAALELAFASGELSVGGRGWRTKRVDLVNRWLTGSASLRGDDPPGPTLGGTHPPGPPLGGTHPPGPPSGGTHPPSPPGDTWLGRISAERIDAWAHGRPGERSRMARALIPRLLEPPALPDDPLPTLGWLLGHAEEGLRLTARHYIAPALVTEAVDTFGWRDQLVGTLRQEMDVFPLHTLRGMAQAEMGAIRRSRTSLVLTKTGKLMAADPAARWHIGTAALIGSDDGPQPDFPVAVREATLLVILTSGPASYDDLTRLLTDIHGVEGWASGGRTGLADAVRTELYTLRHRLWALHLLGRERSFTAPLSLTETGIAAALSALLARALRPRHHLGLG